MAKPGKSNRVACEECFFHKQQLCALNLGEPCSTFRPAERNLEPERQLAFVFRTERITAAYAFPQPNDKSDDRSRDAGLRRCAAL